MGHFEGPNNQQPGGVAKCDDIEMKGLTELLTEAWHSNISQNTTFHKSYGKGSTTNLVCDWTEPKSLETLQCHFMCG